MLVLKVFFALSKPPHFHRAYLVTVRKRMSMAVHNTGIFLFNFLETIRYSQKIYDDGNSIIINVKSIKNSTSTNTVSTNSFSSRDLEDMLKLADQALSL